MKKEKKLTNRQIITIGHIVAYSTLEEARKRARISKGTLYAWLKDEDFQKELAYQRRKVINAGLDRLKYAMTKAIDNLIELMGTVTQPGIKHRICKDIIDYGLKVIEIEDLEERLSNLEEKFFVNK